MATEPDEFKFSLCYNCYFVLLFLFCVEMRKCSETARAEYVCLHDIKVNRFLSAIILFKGLCTVETAHLFEMRNKRHFSANQTLRLKRR